MCLGVKVEIRDNRVALLSSSRKWTTVELWIFFSLPALPCSKSKELCALFHLRKMGFCRNQIPVSSWRFLCAAFRFVDDFGAEYQLDRSCIGSSLAAAFNYLTMWVMYISGYAQCSRPVLMYGSRRPFGWLRLQKWTYKWSRAMAVYSKDLRFPSRLITNLISFFEKTVWETFWDFTDPLVSFLLNTSISL